MFNLDLTSCSTEFYHQDRRQQHGILTNDNPPKTEQVEISRIVHFTQITYHIIHSSQLCVLE